MRSFASISQIENFARIAQCGSLSAAARELHLTPSAVSKSLAQLEERLGVLLIKRTTRSLTLTDSGKIILERAFAILTDAEHALDAARQFGRPEGKLRLTSSIAFGCKQLTPLLGRYLGEHPLVDANVSLDDRCVDLAEENFDVALRITARTDWGYAARALAPIHWAYCAAPSYLDRSALITAPEDLVNHQCLVYPAMTLEGNWSFRRGNDTRHIAINSRVTSNSSLALAEATLNGMGIACLPTYAVSDYIATGALKIVVPEFRSAIVHTLYAMYYRSKYCSPLIRSFVDFLARDLCETPIWDRQIVRNDFDA